MTTIPGGAACYFCLGEEADEEGKPLLRDCSCRGDSAGFAHLSCLTSYAEQKCKQRAGQRDMKAFTEPWRTCNNCKQPFQGQLSIDLASSFVSFAEANCGHPDNSKYDKLRVMAALHLNVFTLKMFPLHRSNTHKEEKTMLNNRLLLIIDQTKKDLNMSSWIHMPTTSEEYMYYKMLCSNYEAFAHLQFAASLDFTEDVAAIGHLKKARTIYNLFGLKIEAQHMDTMILVHTVNMEAATNKQSVSPAITGWMLQDMENEQYLRTKVINSAATIDSGLYYAQILLPALRWFEAERLATKVVTASRRIHGPGHKITIKADVLLKEIKERYVYLFPDNENDGEICVVQGPVTKPRIAADERIHHIANNHLVIPQQGCVVICHGLVSASHLNGELGEVRDMKKSGTGIRLAVHFEKKGAKSALVKTENLRIAFELPDEKE